MNQTAALHTTRAAFASILACTAATAAAQQNLSVSNVLKRPIIGPELSMSEVQAYCEKRVPVMPVVRSGDEWMREADRLRREVLDKVVFRGEAAGWRDVKCEVVWLDTLQGPGYRIRKLRYEALPGLWIPALLYEPEKLSGKVPVVLNVNGHDGDGKAAPYKQIRCINQAKRGMLSLNTEWFGMGQLAGQMGEHYRMNQLDLCGTAGIAPFYLAMSRALDLLLAHPSADPERVAVAGLSGGGWQTIFISSLDTRVKLANPVAGYSGFRTRARFLQDLGDSEQTPCDLATVADYTHMTAMLAPRGALLTYNFKDNCCFTSGHALPPLLEAAEPAYHHLGVPARLRFHVNFDPGTHNFDRENREALYRMIGDLFFAGDAKFSSAETDSASEVKTKEELNAELPAENFNFNSLARIISAKLPRLRDVPGEPAAANKWREEGRLRLRGVIKAKDYTVEASQADSVTMSDSAGKPLQATLWRLRLGGEWTVPAVEFAPAEPKGTVLIMGDEGRASMTAEILALAAEGKRVIAVDPFYFGESRIKSHDHLFVLLIAAVGDRALGIQAGQVASIARWLSTDRKTGPVTVRAIGPRSGVFTVAAAGLDVNAIAAVELRNPMRSLKEVIESNWGVNQKPELFCFGLLEQFDIPQLNALIAPRLVRELVNP